MFSCGRKWIDEKHDLLHDLSECRQMITDLKYDMGVADARANIAHEKVRRRAILAEAKLSILLSLGPVHGAKVCNTVFEEIYSAIDDAKKADT
jgi:hypothetical protein